jgi:TrmH family RNA methyltransferase
LKPVPLRRIESKQNATIKALRKAFANGELTEDGCVAIEGLKTLEEAHRSGLRFRALIVSEAAVRKVSGLLSDLPRDVEAIEVSDIIFRSAVDTESPQGIAALVFPAKHSMKEILTQKDALIIVAAGVQDPGNLGTIIRSAEAFGAAGLILGEGTVSIYNAKTVRASAGSVFRLPCVASKLSDAMRELKKAGTRLIGTSSHKGVSLEKADLIGGLAFVIGSEGAGLPKNVMEQMDEFVKIPQSESVESLNAGVATSIILYEAARQRRAK